MDKKFQRLLTLPSYRKPLFWLLLVLAVGGLFRFYNLNWDLKHSFHPDERNILGATSGLQAGNGYRVNFFAYGQLPVFLYRATGELVSTPAFLWNLLNNRDDLAQGVYWLLLALLGCGLFWFLTREKFKVPAFAATFLLFSGMIFLKFFQIFSIWFGQVDEGPVKFASFILVSTVALGLSFFTADFLEIEWMDAPLYGSAGAIFLMGVVPFFLPALWARTFGMLAFTLLVTCLGLWWAWGSRWGRLATGFLPVWALLASLNHGGHQYTGYGEVMIIGRWWAALFSTATIAAIYLFAKKVYQNEFLGLLAASFFAFSAVSIEQAHYCITESFITLMFVVIALLSHRVIQEASWKNYLWAGAAFGLSMAAKTSSLYYVLILVTAHLLSLSRKSPLEWEKEDKRAKASRPFRAFFAGVLLALTLGVFFGVGLKFRAVLQDLFQADPTLGKGLWVCLFLVMAGIGILFALWGLKEFKVLQAQTAQWIKLAAAGGLSFLIFCLLSPWSLLDYPDFMNSMNYEWSVVAQADACYVLQFKDTLRYFFHLHNLVQVELWWPLGIAAVLGMVWVMGKLLLTFLSPVRKNYILPVPFSRGRGFAFSAPDLLLLSWFIPYFGFIGSWNTKFVRYMVPLIPAFCFFAARFLTDILKRFRPHSVLEKTFRACVLVVVLGGSFFYSAAYMHVYRFPHPWVDASVWIYKNVPPGSLIYNEAWGDGLPVDLSPQQDSRVDKPMSPGLYRSKDLTIYELHGFPTDDSPVKKNYYADLIPQGDYISISSKKLWYTLVNCSPEFKPKGYDVYPVTSRYYRLLWSGLLGYKMVAEFHNFPSLLGWVHPDDMAEESFSVYDHPRVFIFKKFETVPAEKILKMLDTDDYVQGITRDEMRKITPENVDAFIAQRHQYLAQKGLLESLEQAAPVTETTPSKPVPQLVKAKQAPPQSIPAPLAMDESVKVPPLATAPGLPDAKTLDVLKGYVAHPVVEDSVQNPAPEKEESVAYQWRAWFSWLAALVVLGWMALPWTLRILEPLAGGAYALSKVFGFLVFSWTVWFFTSLKICRFTPLSCWVWLFVLAALSAFGFWKNMKLLRGFWNKHSKAWLIQECAFMGAFALFTLVKMNNPHIHDPSGEGYNGGGEAGMNYGFLASIVRGETFPPQNMWMAGLPIGYSYYFGHLMMGILTKTLGLVPAVTFNLAVITLFALIFSCAFGLAYALSSNLWSGWIAGFLCAAAGNLAGAKQYLTLLHQCFTSASWSPLLNSTFDYWGPTRVIPNSINEFPYFSVLFADMHALTLAMPVDMLFVGVVASLYLSQPVKAFGWMKNWPVFLTAGFLLGSIAFLNTWDVATWGALLGIAFLVGQLSSLPGKISGQGIRVLFVTVALALALLGWVGIFDRNLDSMVLGGKTLWLALFLALGLSAGTAVLFFKKKTNGMASHLLTVGIGIVGILVLARIFWAPFFSGFVAQQSEVLWVMPQIRSSLGDLFTIHGFFLSVLALSFLVAYSEGVFAWVDLKAPKKGGADFVERVVAFAENVLAPQNAVQGMVALGLASLALVWGASWAHWSNPPERAMEARLLALLCAGLLGAAIWFKDKLGFWIAECAVVFLWVSAFLLHGFQLFQDSSFTLGLGLFSILWVAGFFHLGLAMKTFRDRKLSFTYILAGLFFLVVATLEIFAMREYLGGEWMRNNSLFKFGIHAWVLASVSTGVFLPKIFSFFESLLTKVKKESALSRKVFMGTSGVLWFILFRLLLNDFLGSMVSPVILAATLVFTGGFLVWAWKEEWVPSWLILSAAVAGAPLLMMPLLPSAGYGSFLALIQKWGSDFGAQWVFPGLLAAVIVAVAGIAWEKRKDMGRRMAGLSWTILVGCLGLMIAVYPLAASIRKCHGFFAGTQRQWLGYSESPTLNGLSYIQRENPEDAAAIRFLNERIPGQPCLLEFVGEGYNSWGSRFSIFTGIPALMGWDGHVKEWLHGRKGMEEDINSRFQATETIFRTTDPALAKKTLDAYGVRLVMVGTVERNGVPGRKGGYPPEGLAKFQTFLPLIYKNSGVEIYYNPPAP